MGTYAAEIAQYIYDTTESATRIEFNNVTIDNGAEVTVTIQADKHFPAHIKYDITHDGETVFTAYTPPKNLHHSRMEYIEHAGTIIQDVAQELSYELS